MARLRFLIFLALIAVVGVAARFTHVEVDAVESFTVAIDSGGDSTWNTDTLLVATAPGCKTAEYRFIIAGPVGDSVPGVGVDDSAAFRLFTTRAGVLIPIDSAFGAAIPCTLSGVIAQATGDTALGRDLYLVTDTRDTTSDTTAAITYEISYWLLLK